jgi:hypothetical protein
LSVKSRNIYPEKIIVNGKRFKEKKFQASQNNITGITSERHPVRPFAIIRAVVLAKGDGKYPT